MVVWIVPLSRDEVGGKRDIGIVCLASPNVARDSQTQSIFFELFLESLLDQLRAGGEQLKRCLLRTEPCR